jgi:Spy/CpxP family protein refolding chaperone
MKRIPLSLTVAALLFAATPAFAGPKQNPGARHEMRARVSAEVIKRLATALALNETDTQKLRTINDKWGPQIEAQDQQMAGARRQLRQLVASRSNDLTALKTATDTFLAAREQHQALAEGRQKDARAALTPQQFAMAVLELPRIEKEVLKEMLSAAGKTEEE